MKKTKASAKKTKKKAAVKKASAKRSSARKAASSAKRATSAKGSAAKSRTPAARAKVAKTVSVGDLVPPLALAATGHGTLNLGALRGKNVVLYFYPKDATPGCTIEGRDFSRLRDAFQAEGTEVFGVSRDTLKSHENFKNKEQYTIELISDPDEQLCQIFDVVKMKNMYGRQVRGIERSTFVIDKEGRIVKEWRAVRVPGHADDVLAFVRTL